MSINQAEATRLARICLPKILVHSNTGSDDDVPSTLLSDVDVSFKSLCRLWAGMGYIYQVTIAMPSLSSSSNKSKSKGKGKSKTYHNFIIKHIVIPAPKHSRRSIGDERKAYSYWIEANYYQTLAPTLIEKYDLDIPITYHIELDGSFDDGDVANSDNEVVGKDQTITICMSLLDGSPSTNRYSTNHIHATLTWLATLHAGTWGTKVDTYVQTKAVQPIGSYWHLDTRPDEHESMSRHGWEGRLKLAARAIHERLRRDSMQCCIHGDAKDANMLFQKMDGGGISVSMYDFQYCGKAPPSVDLAYYLCVAVGDINNDYIQYYHHQLTCKLQNDGIQSLPTLNELEESLSLALCDFQRFMCGWGQWGSDISGKVIEVLDRLDGGSMLGSEDDYREALRREYG